VSDVWNTYFCNVNDKLASIRVDLGIRSAVPDPDRPWLLWVWIYFKQPRPDGLSSDEEFGTLVSIEDGLQNAIEKKCRGVLSGCITTDARREFYFYGATPEGFDETVDQFVGMIHGYKFDCASQIDLDWNQYLNVLFPSEEQRELIENRELLDILKQKGDKLESARDVRHWASFEHQTDRESFRNAVQVLGYRVESVNDSPNGEFRYRICLTKTLEMTLHAVNEAVIQLFRASRSAQGQYEGWECELIVDTETKN
jgi:uncharacterized protein (TIGR01619 family)